MREPKGRSSSSSGPFLKDPAAARIMVPDLENTLPPGEELESKERKRGCRRTWTSQRWRRGKRRQGRPQPIRFSTPELAVKLQREQGTNKTEIDRYAPCFRNGDQRSRSNVVVAKQQVGGIRCTANGKQRSCDCRQPQFNKGSRHDEALQSAEVSRTQAVSRPSTACGKYAPIVG